MPTYIFESPVEVVLVIIIVSLIVSLIILIFEK